jgi:hypothetical protein
MKRTRMVTGFTAAVAAAALATGLAAPVFADSGTGSDTDQTFLQALNSKGIHMTDRDALNLAHSTCAGLQQGGNINGALMHIKNNSNLSNNDAVTFGGFAIYSYCRGFMPKKN